MGNKSSTADENKLKAKTSAELVDYLATHYITSASFKALKKLNEKEYCDRMVILTTDLLNKYFNVLDIQTLDSRVKNGLTYFLPKDELRRLDDSEGKRAVCQNIARFYITVAHVFAAIMTTMNPMVEYIDPLTQQPRQVSILQKDEIPQGVAYEIIHKTSLCDRRIQALKRGHGDVSADETKDTVNVHPRVCDINRRKDGEGTMNLDDEPGIPEFVQLYYDKYNPETGEFDDMTPETFNIFKKDLRIFYEVFTGRTDMPNTVTKFSDIKLRDYHALPKCEGAAPPLDKHVRGSVSQELFKKYAENLSEMINKAAKAQESLMSLLTEMFGYTIEPDGRKQVRLSADLTEAKLQEIVVKCREGIIKLILQCEIDFTNGVKIYEAIIESKLFETVQSQIQNLNDEVLNEQVNVPMEEEEQQPQTEMPVWNEDQAPDGELPEPQNEDVVVPPSAPDGELSEPQNEDVVGPSLVVDVDPMVKIPQQPDVNVVDPGPNPTMPVVDAVAPPAPLASEPVMDENGVVAPDPPTLQSEERPNKA